MTRLNIDEHKKVPNYDFHLKIVIEHPYQGSNVNGRHIRLDGPQRQLSGGKEACLLPSSQVTAGRAESRKLTLSA